MPKIEITNDDLKRLKALFLELDSYEDMEDPWDFQDVEDQAEIGGDIMSIIRPIIENAENIDTD